MKPLTIIILDLTAAASLLVFIWFNLNQLAATRLAQAKLAETSARAAQQDSWQRTLAATAAARATLTQALVTQDTLPSFIEELEKLGQTAGVSLQLITVTPGTETDRDLKLDFVTLGSFRAVWHFAALLDTLPVALEITNSEWNRSASDSKGKTNWQARFNLSLIAAKHQTK